MTELTYTDLVEDPSTGDLELSERASLRRVAGLSTVQGFDDDAGLFGAVASQVMGPFGWILVLSIIISGLASTQTTILPTSRTAPSMARA